MNKQTPQLINPEDLIRKLQEENAELRLRIAELEYDRIIEREGLRVELRQARETTEAARRGYEDLLRVSHDIRTLLSGIINQVILLLGSELTTKQRESAEKLELSRNLLMRLINDIFEFAKIKAGKFKPRYESFSLARCIEKALSLLASRATERGLKLAYIIDDPISAKIIGDSEQLCQILMNLISEVIMWTHGNAVAILVRTSGSQERNMPGRSAAVSTPRYYITVSNTISLTDFSEAAIQCIPASSDNNPMAYWLHSSLGLPISYQLAEVMGGKITMEKDGDRISTFHLVLPFEDAHEE